MILLAILKGNLYENQASDKIAEAYATMRVNGMAPERKVCTFPQFEAILSEIRAEIALPFRNLEVLCQLLLELWRP